MFYEKIASYAEQIISGDMAALEQIYALTYKRIYFIIFQMIKNREDSQDILQETYIQAFSKINTLRDPRLFYSWLIKIAVNLTKSFIRKNKIIIIENGIDEFIDSITGDSQSDASEKVIKSETRGIILELLDLLPNEQKRAVLLYYYENMTSSEIAAVENCSVSTITSRLSYARATLKNAVTAYEKKSHIRLHAGGLALSFCAAASAAEMELLLPVAAAAEIFISVLNALGLGSAPKEGIKYISDISSYEAQTSETDRGKKKILINKIRFLFGKRFVFAVKPVYMAAVALAAVFLIFTMYLFAAIKANEKTSNTFDTFDGADAAGSEAIISADYASSGLSGFPDTERDKEITVDNFNELKKAVYLGKADTIIINGVIAANSMIIISRPVTVTGGEITRYNGSDGAFYKDQIFSVSAPYDGEGTLILKDITLDGCCYDEETDKFIREADIMINVRPGAVLALDGAVIKNNYSVSKTGSTITGNNVKSIDINNSEIKNCRSSYNGGAINIQGGAISIKNGSSLYNNVSEINGGVIAMYNGCVLNIDGSSFVNNSNVNILNIKRAHYEENYCGGVIYSEGENIINISDSKFEYNRSDCSGGVITAFPETEINLTNCVMNNNTAYTGGAVFLKKCKLNINDGSQLNNNEVNELGGAIMAYESEITMNGGIISSNTSHSGGGMLISWGTTITMNGGIISNNSCVNEGGGINMDGQAVACKLVINDGEIFGNTSHNGGAIESLDSAIMINNVKIYNNTAFSKGGALCCKLHKNDENHKDKVYINITGGEIYQNTADKYGGAIYDEILLNITGGSITDNVSSSGDSIYFYDNTEANLTSGEIRGDIYESKGCNVVYGDDLIFNTP